MEKKTRIIETPETYYVETCKECKKEFEFKNKKYKNPDTCNSCIEKIRNEKIEREKQLILGSKIVDVCFDEDEDINDIIIQTKNNDYFNLYPTGDGVVYYITNEKLNNDDPRIIKLKENK